MSAAIEAVLRRAEKARVKRNAFAALMRDVYAFAMPERDGWTSYGYGQDRHVAVYDSTATTATARFANRLQSALFPPQQRWARLALPPELDAAPEAQPLQVDFAAATEKLFAHIGASNFDLAANEWAQELAAGTACMLIENGRLGARRSRAPLLRFQAVPAAQVGFDEGPFGAVEGVFFDQTPPAGAVARLYPDAKLPDDLRRMAAEQEDMPVELLQATVYDPEADQWFMHVIWKDEPLLRRAYRASPWVITRWTRAPGEQHGRGPLVQALPDIRTANKVMELILKAAAYRVTPAWMAADDGVTNVSNVRIVPGAIIIVRSTGGSIGPSLVPLNSGADLQLGDALLQRLNTSTRQVLFDNPLPPEVQVGLTATEVTERVRQFQQDTGAFGRLQADAVVPIVTRCLDILEQAGELADPRFAGIFDLLRDDLLRVRAVSPLAHAQDLADVQAVMGFVSGAAPLGEPGMAMVRAGVDPVKAGRFIAERLGVPAELIPTEEDLAQRDQQAAQAAQAQQILASPAVAQVAGQVARAATIAAPPGEA
jgi:hypothetical protein